ncbi:hypothetical protein G4O51_10525 [Candidatus Bathyarchaeota archaeon A05DMB-2]|jgi:hypothetical protein|nr:hypothetical protein [Candidatus Bathyarchaeota archaeon A05DMB-2]
MIRCLYYQSRRVPKDCPNCSAYDEALGCLKIATKRKTDAKASTLAANATKHHSLPLKAPLKSTVAEAHAEHTKPVNLADSLNYDGKRRR